MTNEISPVQKFETVIVSSLEKVFPDEELSAPRFVKGTALLNETYSFQIAFRSSELIKGIKAVVDSTIKDRITIRSVGLAPSELATYHDHDEHILRSAPGLYPDPLYPLQEAEGITAFPQQWRSIWVTIDLDETIDPGMHTVRISFEALSEEQLSEEVFLLEVIPARLPEQTLLHTEWFHTDCIAVQYGVPVFSEQHWELIGSYMETAAKHGMNMILTPLFTPPLDTQIGGERPTVQLVAVEVIAPNSYRFGFSRLQRWVELCKEKGIHYFEFSHLFTQWGAKHAPKVMAKLDTGEYVRIFGWETDAAGEEYGLFLNQLLPALVNWVKEQQIEKQCYFHISDEPTLDDMKSYESACQLVKKHLKEFPIIDALSDYVFYEKGLVENPIPANNHIEPFLDNGVQNLWTYYCCAQYKEVSNRFFNMPSARNRIIGAQLYKYQIAGFLHWGYNFWFSQHSRGPIDPYRNTDANYAFPSGDPFLVYPGVQGPIESMRLEVFYEALQDLRALQLLEQLYGREYVMEGLEKRLEEPLTFSTYPREAEWLLSFREWVNDRIKEKAAVCS